MSKFNSEEIQKIKSLNDDESKGAGCNFEVVEFFEKEFESKFPESYKDFLINFGSLSISSYEPFEGSNFTDMSGRNKNPNTWDILNINKELNEAFSISKRVLPIHSIGNGDYLAINLHQYNHETKEAPIWYLAHEELFDENFEEIKNPDYSLTVEEYEKKNWNFWRPTKYKDFKEMLMDAIDKKLSLETF
jgi:hypothetical protein